MFSVFNFCRRNLSSVFITNFLQLRKLLDLKSQTKIVQLNRLALENNSAIFLALLGIVWQVVVAQWSLQKKEEGPGSNPAIDNRRIVTTFTRGHRDGM